MPAFLDLPREIRDQIYELNLVHGSIPIGTTQPFLQISYGQIVHELKDPYGLCYRENCITIVHPFLESATRRNVKRSVRDGNITALIKNTDGRLISKSVQKSYGQPEVADSGFATEFYPEVLVFDSQNLSVFLANRQIYREASEIFYSRNKFDFGCQHDSTYFDSMENVWGFLQDRSEHGLRHLRSIRFALGETSYHSVCDQDWYKGSKFTMLCKTLAEKCKLIELSVGIMGIPRFRKPHPYLEQLVKIKNLQRLHIWIHGSHEPHEDEDAVKSALRTMMIFRSQSLLGGDKMEENDIQVAYLNRFTTPMVRVSTWKAETWDRF